MCAWVVPSWKLLWKRGIQYSLSKSIIWVKALFQCNYFKYYIKKNTAHEVLEEFNDVIGPLCFQDSSLDDTAFQRAWVQFDRKYIRKILKYHSATYQSPKISFLWSSYTRFFQIIANTGAFMCFLFAPLFSQEKAEIIWDPHSSLNLRTVD